MIFPIGALLSAILLLGLLAWAVRVARTKTEALRRSEAELQARSAEIDAVFASMVDGILVIGPDLEVLRWNSRFPEVAGVPPELMRKGLPMVHILRAQAESGEFGAVDVEQEVARRMAQFRAGINFGTVERSRPDGRVMELRRSPMDGGGLVTLYTDITARRRAEDQLRQAQKMEAVGQLTSGIAHDFNNLLSVIIGNIDLIEHSAQGGNMMRVQRHVDSARMGSSRASTLVQRLLAFARQQKLEPSALDINKVVGNMSELIRHSIGTVNHLEVVLAGGLWEAVADSNQLENALLNLAVNARDAIEGGGKITIETANTYLDETYAAEHEEVTAGQFVMVAVSDDGAGMASDQVTRAFEPFYTTKEVGKGSGLGLSQVFGFIKQSGGHVKIYSEVGVGTTVKLYLPRAMAAELEPVVPAPVERADDTASNQECVLVVEDDPDVLAYAQDGLSTLGYQVVAVKDGASALQALVQHPDISLLFTDLELPDLKGQQLAEQATLLRPDLPVLFTTGYTVNDIIHRGAIEPGARMLSKPFTLMQLGTQVREALDERTERVE